MRRDVRWCWVGCLACLVVIGLGFSAWGAAPPPTPQVPGGPTVPGDASNLAATPAVVTTMPAHPAVDLSSPRAAMFTFLQGMSLVREEDPAGWNVALSALDFSQVSFNHFEQQQAAWQLLGILDRLGEVTETELPDARIAGNAMQFTYFPRFPQHDFVFSQLKDATPKEEINLSVSNDGWWRFSPQTVAGLGSLYRTMVPLQPRYVAGQTQVINLISPTWEKTRLWGWLLLLGAVFGGVLVGRLLQAILTGMSNRLEKKGWDQRATIFANAASPASLAIVTAGIAAGMQFIYMEEGVGWIAWRIVALLYIVALGWFLYNLADLVDVTLTRITAKTQTKLDDMLVPLIRKTLRIFLIIIFSLVIAQNVFGLNITGWLAGLGIAGLAVSLAAQDSIKNLFGSITIFFDQPFGVGDRIKFDGYDGPVEEIGFRSTRIRTLEGHLVTVPNMRFNDNSVENVGRRPSLRRILDVTITYDTPVEKIEQAVQILKDILNDPAYTPAFDMDKTPPRVHFDNFNAASLNIRMMYWYVLADGRDWWTYQAMSQEINLRIFREYEAAGIEFAFPTQTLYLAGDPRRQLTVAMQGYDPQDRLPPA